MVVVDEVTVGEDAVAGAGDDVFYIDNVLDLARGLRRYFPATVFGGLIYRLPGQFEALYSVRG